MRKGRFVGAVGAATLCLTCVGGVASADDTERSRDKTTYEVVDGVSTPDIFEGDLNASECYNEDGSQREYRFWDGTLKVKQTTIYSPSQAAFDEGVAGATMSVTATSAYKGLWDRNGVEQAIYEARGRDRVLEVSAMGVVNVDGSVTESVRFVASFEFLDTTTGMSTGDYYNVDGVFTTINFPNGDVDFLGFEGTNDGTCVLDEGP